MQLVKATRVAMLIATHNMDLAGADGPSGVARQRPGGRAGLAPQYTWLALFSEVVSNCVLQCGYSNFSECCLSDPRRPWGLHISNGNKNEEGFACYGQPDRARRGCAGTCCGSRGTSLHQGAADDGSDLRLERFLHRRQRRLGFEPQQLGLPSSPAWSVPRVATMRPAALPVARSVIAGRPAPGCSASKRRATGLTSTAAISACSSPGSVNNSKIDAFGLFTGQVGCAANNVLFYVKGGAAVTSNKYRSSTTPLARSLPAPVTTPAGVARSASASNMPSRRTGRLRSNTITCSCRIVPSTSPRRAAVCRQRSHPSGRRSRHRPRELQFGGPVIARY